MRVWELGVKNLMNHDVGYLRQQVKYDCGSKIN